MVEIELPISFFICYGKEKGRKVAETIRDFPMDRELFKPFLASPYSQDMASGDDFDKILQVLRVPCNGCRAYTGNTNICSGSQRG